MEITRTSAATPNPAVDRALEPRKPQETQKTAPSDEAITTGETESTEEPSGLKSFAYGALDLDKPETKTETTESAYTAGKWLGAAAKVGGLISLLV